MKIYFTFCMFLLIGIIDSQAQAPSQMNYQTVVRDNTGAIVPNNTNVSFHFIIHDGSGSGSSIYTETQSTTTNQFGLVNLQIGSVTSLSGIDWSNGLKWLEVDVSINGGAYSMAGNAQLISVPYAMYAGNGAVGPTGAAGPTGAMGATGITGPTGSAAAHVGFYAYETNSITIPAGNLTQITFDASNFNDGNGYATSAFTAPSSGLYNFNSGVRLDGTTAGDYCYIALQVNGAIFTDVTGQTSAAEFGLSIATDIMLNSGDVVTVAIYSNDATPTLPGGTFNVWFSGHQVY